MNGKCHHTCLALALAAAALSGCESSGHFTVLGYTTRPNYDTCIHTVYVPTFSSQVMIDSTRRTLHEDLTKAVIREIEANRAARFWLRIFGLSFALGVVTGIPLEFRFGTNWSRFSRASG